MKQPPPRSQLRRFYTGLGLFASCIALDLLAVLLARLLADMPPAFYLWLHHLQTACVVTLGVLLVLAAWRAAAIIACEDHLLLALADKIRAQREELERKEKQQDD